MKVLAQNCQKRRLEKGLSRDALADLSKVPAATIAKFETKHVISLVSFVALAKALGYTNDLKQLLSEPLYNTMAELDEINRNLFPAQLLRFHTKSSKIETVRERKKEYIYEKFL